MKSSKDFVAKDLPKVAFDWAKFVSFIMSSPKELKRIGPAWILLLDICLNSDQSGIYSTTYLAVSRRYQVAPITVKKWRKHLCDGSVIESFSRGYSVAFRLLEPFSSFLKYAPQQKSETNKLLLETVLRALGDQELLHAA